MTDGSNPSPRRGAAASRGGRRGARGGRGVAGGGGGGPPAAERGEPAAISGARHAGGELRLGGGERTLEDIVRELLRPLLGAWLDQQLPTLVETLVRAEIARAVGDSRLR